MATYVKHYVTLCVNVYAVGSMSTVHTPKLYV